MIIKRTTTAPVNGTNEKHTVTIGGTPTSGTFKVKSPNLPLTGAITWSNNNTTLLANIQAAFDAIAGTNNVLAENSTLSSGIGNFFLTFQNLQGKQPVGTLTFVNALAGTVPTLADSTTTPGVLATFRSAAKGQLLAYVTPDPPAMYWNISNNVANPDWEDFQTP